MNVTSQYEGGYRVRLRLFTILAIGAMVATPGAMAHASSAGQAPGLAHRGVAARPAVPGVLSVLYSQDDNDAGVGIVSQNFTDPGFDIYDSQGADDFVVPVGHTWFVKAMTVTGVYFNGPGPADSETVTFYRDAGGLPGVALGSVTVHGLDTAGSFRLKLSNRGLRMRAGTYWVSVQPTMAFSPNGEWGWETRTLQANSAAAWQNPQDGFGTGCTTYANMQGCIGAFGEGPDFMFAIYGTST